MKWGAGTKRGPGPLQGLNCPALQLGASPHSPRILCAPLKAAPGPRPTYCIEGTQVLLPGASHLVKLTTEVRKWKSPWLQTQKPPQPTEAKEIYGQALVGRGPHRVWGAGSRGCSCGSTEKDITEFLTILSPLFRDQSPRRLSG